MKTHQEKVLEIQKRIKTYLDTKDKRKIVFDHGSSNSTRYQDTSEIYRVDLSELDGILGIDVDKKYVTVEPNVPMDRLLAYTLKYGLTPPRYTRISWHNSRWSGARWLRRKWLFQVRGIPQQLF